MSGPRRRRSFSPFYLVVLALLAFAGWVRPPAGEVARAEPVVGRVQWVTDGDTLAINNVRIRLWGIDAPERDAPAGPEATRALSASVRGKVLNCLPVGRSHERVVAQCKVGATDLSAALVFAGWARDLPNKSRGAYQALEAEARAAGRGMWKAK